MPVLIHVDVYASRNVYAYDKPERMLVKKFALEEQVHDLIKFVTKEFKRGSASYWFMVISRQDFDQDDWIKTEVIQKKHPLKERIQLNTDAKGKAPKPKSRFAHLIMPATTMAALFQPLESPPVTQTENTAQFHPI